MKINKKMFSNIVFALAIAFVVYLGYRMLYSIRYFITEINTGKERQVHLLCETDYQVLLNACRKLSKQIATEELKPEKYVIRKRPYTEVSRFPKPILDLKPTYISIRSNGIVMVELYGLLGESFGILSYPEDYKVPSSSFHYGDKKLIEGLWYYDSEYRDEYPKHKKKIDELIQKGKIKQADISKKSVNNINNGS